MRNRMLTVMATLGGLLIVTGSAPPTSFAVALTARNVIASSGLGGTTETWEATTVDYDNDGDLDVMIGLHDQGQRLFRNNGAGWYVQVAATVWPRRNSEGGIPDRHACRWADVDQNGLQDVYCASGRGGDNTVKYAKDNELWLQGPVGQFRDVAAAWGVGDLCGRSHYVAFLDANGDRFPDLFVANAEERPVADACDDPANGLTSEFSKLYLNDGGTGYTLDTTLGLGGNGGTRCAEVMDYNRDGYDDLLLCGPPRTQLYNGSATGFVDVTAANGLTLQYADAGLGDLDGDGDLDMVTAIWSEFAYRLNNNGVFGRSVRIAAVPSGGGGRSVAIGDADGDGDMDVYGLISNVPNQTNPNDRIFVNNRLRFTSVWVPGAGGVGDAVIAIDGNADRKVDFLVMNGNEKTGPTQLIRLVTTP